MARIIGEGADVTAGAVATKDMRAHNVVAGVPAKSVDSFLPGEIPSKGRLSIMNW